MKKYEAPVTEIVEIEAADVITASNVPGTSLPGTAFTYGPDGSVTGRYQG